MASQAPHSQKRALIAAAAFIGMLAVFAFWIGIQGAYPNGPGLMKTEKLVVSASPDASNGTLVITVTNISPFPVTIDQVLFNNVWVALGNITAEGDFNSTSASALQLVSGTTGELQIDMSALNITSGHYYAVTVVTAAGNSYPYQSVWP